MHELSIAEALVDGVRSTALDYPQQRVRRVLFRVGSLRLVAPDALQLCYRAITKDDELMEGSELIIDVVPARGYCTACHTEFSVAEQWFLCPRCGCSETALSQGQELVLDSIDLEEPAPAVSVI